ncbi:ubiquitin carboxyl-terminal hydrolase 15-like [Antedon mediterranea]|uniref:ubiquitin carboxyl-terminal hydrolase 15-like n=1 Tax=Antedon mediterranea TaxID=105859 RepID=UPI003AF88E4A
MAEGGAPKLDEQKKEIFDLIKTPLRKGDTWYLVDSKWFKQWKKYVGYDSWDMYNVGQETAFPGPVDNSQLLKLMDEGSVLKENLIDDLDYVLVPTSAWEKLILWYGIMEGQEPIARKVVEHGMFVKHCKVEVYLMELKLCKNSNPTDCVSKQFSKADTIETIESVMRDAFNISDKTEIRIWNKYMSNTYEQLAKKDNTVQDAGLYQGQVLVVEQKNDDGSWPRQTTNSYSSSSTSSTSRSTGSSSRSSGYGSSYSSSYSSSSYDYGGSRGSAKPGLCGLSNLGNTCFMNSALQCMSNVPPLTRYFVVNSHEQELNENNPLGMKGEIARAYAELIKQMWCGRYSYTVPRNFKMQVGRFAPQFSGYQQQDSQELLGFLLDGLHEDLNRIKKKPYIELKEGDGRPDHEVSKEAWDNHLQRNNSIIVDFFHGLFKSTLDCPTCHKRSVTFDPFCFLTLPLPIIDKERILEVFVVRMDPTFKPIQMKVTVPKMGVVSDLCKAVHTITNINEDMMVVTDVYNHRFHKVFGMDVRLETILDRDDIFVYEVPVNTPDHPETLILPIYLRERGGTYYSSGGTTLFGQPMLIPVNRNDTTYDDLYNIIMHKMSRYVRQPLNDDWYLKNGKEDDEENKDEHQENGEMDSTSDSEDVNDNEEQQETKESERNGVVDEDNKSNKTKQRKRLFSMVQVNSYGSSDISKVKDDAKPIKFTNRTYIALDWVAEAKRQFYLSEEAEAFEKHESVKNTVRKKPVIKLDDCIKLFLTKEQLGKDDLWYCPECKEHRQAYKKFDLWKLPKILVINLKRFSYNRYWRDKLDAHVVYPVENFNIKEYVLNEDGGPFVYDLLGVVNHYGGLGGGHYTAYAKNIEDQQWYNFDDSSVSAVDKDSVISKAGYVLFYMRKDPDDARHRRVSASLASPEEDDDIPDTSTNDDQAEEEEEDMETDPS